MIFVVSAKGRGTMQRSVWKQWFRGVGVLVSNDDAIIRLLTEIRENQREEIAWRKKVIEESVRLQRAALRWQRLALLVGGLVIAAGALVVVFAKQLFGE
jgi:hypothetical protein